MHLLVQSDALDAVAIADVCSSTEAKRCIEVRRKGYPKSPFSPSNDAIWKAMVLCLCSTRQKMGAGSKFNAFKAKRPFPLSLKRCRSSGGGLLEYVRSAVSVAGLQRGKLIAQSCSENFTRLTNDKASGFKVIRAALEALSRAHDAVLERATAATISELLHGIGPKQSRNFLQEFGLLRHEVLLDAKVTKWMKANLVPAGTVLPLSSSMLGDEQYYSLIVDKIQEACRIAKVLPADLDAAVFGE